MLVTPSWAIRNWRENYASRHDALMRRFGGELLPGERYRLATQGVLSGWVTPEERRTAMFFVFRQTAMQFTEAMTRFGQALSKAMKEASKL